METEYGAEGVRLHLASTPDIEEYTFGMEDCPDLIPSIAVAASQRIKKTIIQGVSTLRIKECDRVHALKTELAKFGVRLEEIGEETIVIHQSNQHQHEGATLEFYNDHRMAMCLAPLAALHSSLELNQKEVVEKSFPSFWTELAKTGVTLTP